MILNKKEVNLEELGIIGQNNIHRNLSVDHLIDDIIENKEGVIGLKGAAMVDTGIYTGRSPKDKYIVEEKSSVDDIWWGDVNKKISSEIFDILYNKILDYYNKDNKSKTYVFDGFAGADKNYALNIRIIAKKAWQSHFVHNMFIRPNKEELEGFIPEFTIINASEVHNKDFKKLGMNSETFIIFNLQKKIAIIGGTEYGGEMKKGIFSVLHYLLPQKNVLSMHCSANVDLKYQNPVIFFGLSGTGKTTLSTDPNRPLIGDDEHGWSDDGIFNFEGGCYAKLINLNPEEEPDIYNAIRKGALVENVVYDSTTKKIDFSDGSKTQNTRVSYPLNHIENSVYSKGQPSIAGHPEKIIFLTCDAYGIIPPVSRLNPNQAMYHFISGYTAKVAGTELGVTEPVATFSPCFGGPFLTLHPLRYAELLKVKMQQFNTKIYMVNTGWVGNTAQSGEKRFSLPKTRLIINSILDGSIEKSDFHKDPYFKFDIPKTIPEIESSLLNPIEAWADKQTYGEIATKLVHKFQENYKKYDLGDNEVLAGGPLLNR